MKSRLSMSGAERKASACFRLPWAFPSFLFGSTPLVVMYPGAWFCLEKLINTMAALGGNLRNRKRIEIRFG